MVAQIPRYGAHDKNAWQNNIYTKIHLKIKKNYPLPPQKEKKNMYINIYKINKNPNIDKNINTYV